MQTFKNILKLFLPPYINIPRPGFLVEFKKQPDHLLPVSEFPFLVVIELIHPDIFEYRGIVVVFDVSIDDELRPPFIRNVAAIREDAPEKIFIPFLDLAAQYPTREAAVDLVRPIRFVGFRVNIAIRA